MRNFRNFLLVSTFTVVVIAIHNDLHAAQTILPPQAHAVGEAPLLTPAPLNDADQTQNSQGTRSLASARAAVNSRGTLVATTQREWQANSTMGRIVDVDPPVSAWPGVQFAFTHQQSSYAYARWGYQAYYASEIWGGMLLFGDGTPVVQAYAFPAHESGSFPKINVLSGGRAILAGTDCSTFDNDPLNRQIHFSWDDAEMGGSFGGIFDRSRMSDVLESQGNFIPNSNTMWPTMDISEVDPDNPIIYLAAFESSSGMGAMKVYRKQGLAPGNPDATWSLVFTDTAFYPSQDISCDRTSGKVAVSWTKYTTEGKASGNSYDSDVWYAESPTGMSGSWTRSNVTNYAGNTYRAWIEVASLYDHSGKLHIIWNGRVGNGQTDITTMCQLFHWSQWLPSQIQTIHNAEFDPRNNACYGGLNVMNVGRFSIGECQNRLYVIYTAFEDPTLNMISGDCSSSGSRSWAANGELFVQSSTTLQGATWTNAYNLSDSRTAGCISGECADDRWASISRYSFDDALFAGTEAWPSDSRYDPSGIYSGTEYLSVYYLTDREAGASNYSQGSVTTNDLRWIRLACYQPPSTAPAALVCEPASLKYPLAVAPSQLTDITITLKNPNPFQVSILSVSVIGESSVPAGYTGWLGYSGAPAVIPSGSSATMHARIDLTAVAAPVGTILSGSLKLNSFTMQPSNPVSIYFSATVAASPSQCPAIDTLSSSCINLAVTGDGRAGLLLENASMDFLPAAECDTGSNSRGNADRYLYDASTVVFHQSGPTLSSSWSMYSFNYPSTYGFVLTPSYAPPASSSNSDYTSFTSGTFMSHDSAVLIEKTWYAPKASDSCNFILQKTIFFPRNISSPVTNLTLGEAADWDIASDVVNAANQGGYSASERLLWFRGYHSLMPVGDCRDNSRRYGGMAYLWSNFKDGAKDSTTFAAYYRSNDSTVFANSNFDPQQLYTEMQLSGQPSHTDDRTTDLHGVIRYRTSGLTIPANDTLTVWTVLASTYDSDPPTIQEREVPGSLAITDLKDAIRKSKTWVQQHLLTPPSCCIGTTGNVNKSASETPDLSDLSLLISYLVQSPRPTLPCVAEANINASLAQAPDLSDLSLLIAYMTQTPKPTLPTCP